MQLLDHFKRKPREAAHRELMVELFRELFQAERSAADHCVREAERLGDVGPAAVLRTIAVHALQSLNELPLLASAEGLPASGVAQALGSFFSTVRTTALDWLVQEQISYRGTLLGLRHGLDVARLLGHTADETMSEGLGEWCGEWVLAREPLVRVATEELAWFAQNPHLAIAGASRATQRAAGPPRDPYLDQASDPEAPEPFRTSAR